MESLREPPSEPLSHTLAELKSIALDRIAEAARKGEVTPLRALGELAASIDADLRAVREIEARRIRYARDLTGEPDAGEPGPAEPDPRAPFLEAAAKAGHPLTPLSRTLYRTPAGKAVAVPFANEARPGRWLLSVEDMRYDLVALLCRPTEGDLRVFVVPRRALEPVWKGLSRNGRQVKLGVMRRPDGYWLSVPGTEPLSITPFLEGYGLLASAG